MLIKKERIPVRHILLIGLLPSFLKKWVYRMKGYRIDKNVSLSLGSVIIGKQVRISEGVKIGFFTIIRAKEITLERFCRIGALSVLDTERIFVDEDARINEQVYVGGMKTPQSSFHLGKRAIIMQLSYLNPTLPIHIGDDSGIGGHCLFFTHGSWNSQLEGFPVKFAPITLGKKVWLPWRVFIMPGVNIGDGVVVGANSLVGTDLPAHTLAAGSPAKVIRSDFPALPSDEQKDAMIGEMFNSFFEYLRYHGLTVDVDSREGEMRVSINGNPGGRIFYINQSTNSVPYLRNEIVVLRNGGESKIRNIIEKGAGMCVSIEACLRAGSNPAGEELLAFFSRYGVRFARL